MGQRTIDWSTASVSRGESGFDLTVELDGEASSDWQTLFAQLAEQDAIAPQGRGWSLVRVGRRTITMERLEHEAREAARSYLGDVVVRTNEAVAAKLEEEERERLRIEREAAEIARVAEELAGWFRSAPTDLNRAQETTAPDAAAEGDDAKDLRDRLAHPFGLGSE
jgi:hypothetical protein